jgi:hypothetical protein
VFSSSPIPKNFESWFIILQTATKHHAKIFVKDGSSPFWILASTDKKTLKKNPHSQP